MDGRVHLAGMALASALGPDLPVAVTALQGGIAGPTRVRVDGLDEPLEAACYRIDDGRDLFDPGRMAHWVPEVACQAVAGLPRAARRDLAIFVGSTCFSVGQGEAAYARMLAHDPAKAVPMPRTDFHYIAALAREAVGSQGPDFTWNTACTSSANGVLLASEMLRQGLIDHALVLGVELANRTSFAGFASLQLLADVIRPFARDRAGLVLGEAVAAVLLTQGESELMLRGGAIATDLSSLTTPRADGQSLARVQRQALRHAEVRAEEVCLVKAHATGTQANDLAEAHGIAAVHAHRPPVTALKPFVGHTLGACGVAELALLAGACRAGFVPAASSDGEAEPDLGIRVLDGAMTAPKGIWQLNQFGFGGNNDVLLLEVC